MYKAVLFRGSAPHPAGGHDAPRSPSVGGMKNLIPSIIEGFRHRLARFPGGDPMPEIDLTTPLPPLVIGATGQEAIAQNIRIIVTTLAWSVPLDRGFASSGGFIDAPTPYAVARKIAELTEVIETKEPRVKVESIRFASRPDDMVQGRVYPVISFSLRAGAAA